MSNEGLLILGISFSKKEYLGSKTENMNITNSAYSDYIETKLQIKKKQFRNFVLNLSKNGISGVKLKKLTLPSNSAHFSLKGTWGKSNNLCLKLSFFIIKENGIKFQKLIQKFQKLTCKPRLACFVYSFACMPPLTSRYRLIIQKLRNFIPSWKMIKNTTKLFKSVFSNKINKKNAKKSEVKCSVHSRVRHHLRWIQNCVTLSCYEIWWKRHKTMYQALSP